MSKNLFELSLKCVQKLISAGKTVAFAESCTGGLIAKSLTDHSGASDVFECGVVSYSGRIKNMLLGVDEKTLNTFGEVSPQTACEMANGVRLRGNADFGIGVTGIAGPGGATSDKKVGLIYISISYADRCDSYTLELYDQTFERCDRRNMTACFVFEKLIDLLS